MLLCRENPKAQRIRPSQGDGGIDVYVPNGDSMIVYQVKAVSSNLTSNQKRQITNSLDRVVAYAAIHGLDDLAVAVPAITGISLVSITESP